MTYTALFLALVALCLVALAQAFVPMNKNNKAPHAAAARPSASQLYGSEEKKGGGFFDGVSNFFQELDNFMDDASARRLGNGAAFYGECGLLHLYAQSFVIRRESRVETFAPYCISHICFSSSLL